MKLSIIVKKIVMLIVLGFVMGAVGQSVLAQNLDNQNLARFSGGIGDISTGSTNTTVRGVAAAGQIWVIRDLAADVKQDGSIRLDGRASFWAQAMPSEATATRAYLRRCSAQMTGISNTAQILQASRLT